MIFDYFMACCQLTNHDIDNCRSNRSRSLINPPSAVVDWGFETHAPCIFYDSYHVLKKMPAHVLVWSLRKHRACSTQIDSAHDRGISRNGSSWAKENVVANIVYKRVFLFGMHRLITALENFVLKSNL